MPTNEPICDGGPCDEPATTTVRWPQGTYHYCDKHAAKAKEILGALGGG